MLQNKNWLWFFLFVIFLSGCSSQQQAVNHEYLFLMGESESWKVNDYEIFISPDRLKVGNGTLSLKNSSGITADYFSYELHAVVHGEDLVMHTKTVTGDEIRLSSVPIGTLEGENGESIELNKIKNIYIKVEWRTEGKMRVEKIDLYKGNGAGA